MTVQDFITNFQKIEELAQTGLKTVEALSPDPTVDVTAEAISAVLPIVSSLVFVAMSAWSKANSQPIDTDAIQALLPNPVALSQPAGA